MDPARGAALVETRGLTRVYGARGRNPVRALDGVDLDIARGEFTAVVGPSGSGKSTLLHLLGALDSPTSGSVRVDGVELGSLDDHARTRLRRERIGFVFQFFNLLPLLSATENAALPLRLAGQPREAAAARAAELLDRVGLAARADHRPDELSGGERQRLALARALSARPALLLADEPTGNLDQETGAGILDLFEELSSRDRVAVVMVTHDPAAAARARRVVRLIDGRVAADS